MNQTRNYQTYEVPPGGYSQGYQSNQSYNQGYQSYNQGYKTYEPVQGYETNGGYSQGYSTQGGGYNKGYQSNQRYQNEHDDRDNRRGGYRGRR